jgi:2-hydroxy-3-keto-5-methylthiopentenyl-1-phosphate phosphatase
MASLELVEAHPKPSYTDFERAIRAVAPKKCRDVLLTDLDGTVYGPDTTVVLNEQFGSRDAAGVPHYKHWREQHSAGLLQIGEHLGREFEDVFDNANLEEMLEFLKRHIKPFPGARAFMRRLRDRKIKRIGLTNGVQQIAIPLLGHHRIKIKPKRVIGNRMNFDHPDGAKFETLSGAEGLDKGAAVEWFLDHRYRVHGVIGDSGGDVGLAMAAGKNKIPVFAAGHDSALAKWCARNGHLLRASWRAFDDWRQIIPYIPAAA